MTKLIIKPGREESLYRHHPWIYSGSMADVVGNPQSGETIDVYSARGDFLAKASYSPHSKIIARVWTWFREENVDAEFFYRKIMSAVRLRENYKSLFLDTDACRLVHGESDGLPGLIVDRYKNIIVIQLLTAGAERWRYEIVDALQQVPGVTAIYERSDADVRELEGLKPLVGLLWGILPEEPLIIRENNLLYNVDIHSGHKTGFYLDQRASRRMVRLLAQGHEILDCFSYTGGFTTNALAGGASKVVAVDSSSLSLVILQQNISLNNQQFSDVELIHGDVFQKLRLFRDQGRSFDMIILDPPKFAHTSLMVERAARGYKDINLLAFKMLRTSGLLFTFSCSGGVNADLFQKIVARAALDAGVEARVLRRLQQDIDHPVSLTFPEGNYLKGLIIVVDKQL
jgi:23S rRNA (cytosine1962-C5)-methyltransferase